MKIKENKTLNEYSNLARELKNDRDAKINCNAWNGSEMLGKRLNESEFKGRIDGLVCFSFIVYQPL